MNVALVRALDERMIIVRGKEIQRLTLPIPPAFHNTTKHNHSERNHCANPSRSTYDNPNELRMSVVVGPIPYSAGASGTGCVYWVCGRRED